MSNKLRDLHDPVIPGEYVHPPEGHGGVSMLINQSNPDFDPHEPVLPEGMHGSESYEAMQRRVEGTLHLVPKSDSTLPSAADLDAVETDKEVTTATDPVAQYVADAQATIDQQKAATDADSTAKAEGAKAGISR